MNQLRVQLFKQGQINKKLTAAIFVLTQENVDLLRFHFQANRKAKSSSKNGSRDF